MSCCLFGKFPKKYLYYVENSQGEKLQLYVGEETHRQIQEARKDHPEAKLIIKE